MAKHFCLDNSPHFELIELNEIDSTNAFLKHYRPMESKDVVVITAEYQTSGRGQRGNSWESASGENLLFSIRIHPQELPANEQFIISQAISLAIKETLSEYTDNISIKWPNDIYWKEQKICGILIENDLIGKYVHNCIIGVGINLNQSYFSGNAPNPVSLIQITNTPTEKHFILKSVLGLFLSYYNMIQLKNTIAIAQAYHQSLFHRTGIHSFCDNSGVFEACIVAVEPTGHLILKDSSNHLRRYAFKEVKHILDKNTCL